MLRLVEEIRMKGVIPAIRGKVEEITAKGVIPFVRERVQEVTQRLKNRVNSSGVGLTREGLLRR